MMRVGLTLSVRDGLSDCLDRLVISSRRQKLSPPHEIVGNQTEQRYYSRALMKAVFQRSDPFFRSALWIIVISWVTIVLLVFAFYFSVLLLNSLLHR